MATVSDEHRIVISHYPLLQPPARPLQRSLSRVSIYKVPESLRKQNLDAYTPHLISIGPIHHGKTKLKSMEDTKQLYSDSFWNERVRDEQAVGGYGAWLATQEQSIRNLYSEKFDFNSDKFREIIFLDSVFIMELFLKFEEEEEEDFILSNEWRRKFIQRDLVLLENQLPIYVLQKLYTYLPNPDEGNGQRQNYSFVEIAEMYFKNYYPTEQSECRSFNQPVHFTDLVRNFYIAPNMTVDHSPREVLKTATKLNMSGINFEAAPRRRLLDIEFKKGSSNFSLRRLSCIPILNKVEARLLLPKFKINRTTEWTLRNLIAFEQCHYPHHAFICNYIIFLDYLIDSKEDVDLLVESSVLVHELGNDTEVVTLINGLSKNVMIPNNCYNQWIKELNKHYSNGCNYRMAQLRSVYFRDLWRGSSTIAALVVLFITLYNFVHDALK